jgi:hypothetical protein
VDVIHGACDLKPDVVMSMKADVSCILAWKDQPDTALSKKQIVAEDRSPRSKLRRRSSRSTRSILAPEGKRIQRPD